MNRVSQTLAVIAWTLLAAALFSLFGLIVGSGAGRAVVTLGWLPESRRMWVTGGVWALCGVLLLGLSRVYRRHTEQDNAGSVAAWLAGWALLLYGVSSLLASVSVVLVVGFLVAVLAVWEVRKMLALSEAAAKLGGPVPDPDESERAVECEPDDGAGADDLDRHC
jgi:hypothetical protein